MVVILGFLPYYGSRIKFGGILMRKYYLDNIRWITVILVVLYHGLYVVNGQKIPGGLGPVQSTVQYHDGFLYFVYPWFMALLFLVSGMSARFSLEKRGARTFLIQRTISLLVPSTLGVLVFHFLTGLFMMKVWHTFPEIPKEAVIPVSILSGIGPLWFSQVLWVFSLILALLGPKKISQRLLKMGEGVRFPMMMLFGVLVFLASQVLNAPVLTFYRFGIYGFMYFLGYFVFSHEAVMDQLTPHGKWLLPLAIVTGIVYTVVHFGKNYVSPEVLQSPFTSFYTWLAILAILAYAKAHLNKKTPLTKRMTTLSQGIYSLHYLPVVVTAWLFKEKRALGPWGVYVLSIISTLILTLVLYETIKRIPIYRTLVLGIRRNTGVKR